MIAITLSVVGIAALLYDAAVQTLERRMIEYSVDELEAAFRRLKTNRYGRADMPDQMAQALEIPMLAAILRAEAQRQRMQDRRTAEGGAQRPDSSRSRFDWKARQSGDDTLE